jgi:ATP-dependent DNA helicase RecG
VSEGTAPLLRHFDLLDGDAMRKACAILFHPEPDRVVLGAYVEIGIFSAEGELLREDTVKSPAIMQPEAAVNLIYEKHIQGTYRIDGLFRETEYAYPRVAVREALTNAIVHRDYSVFLPTAVSIYPDSLEIMNYGGLPAGWTVDKLLAKHNSVPRNFRMARVFHDAGLIEKWGTGINTIFKACREAGTADPEYEVGKGEVRVTFRSRGGDRRGKAVRKEGVTDNEMHVISLLDRKEGMTGMELRAASSIGETAAKYAVATLSKKGLIVKKDGKRKDKWILSEEGKKYL